MTYDVVMPQLGLTMEEGAVVSWQKKVGDWVKKGDVLFIVETDKSEMEVESTDSGYLNDIQVELGKKVRVGTVIAMLGDQPGEVTSAAAPAAATHQAAHQAAKPVATAVPAHSAEAEPATGQDEFAASPRARKLAKELGIDIRRVMPASGRRVVEEDVRRQHESVIALNAASSESSQSKVNRMRSSDALQGKKTLVTGAGTGIGREIALEFARQGSDVVLHFAKDSGADSAAEEIRKMGRRATVIRANFENLDEVEALAAKAAEFLGGIDCLVNNAGVTFNRPFLKITREQFDFIFNVNFRAEFFLTQRVVEIMLRSGGGAVCNLTSIHGVSGAPEHSLYAATKGAIIAYTRTLAVELAHKGVRVNAIAPGWITVDNYFKAVPGFTEEIAAETTHRMIPAARAGKTLDVAKLAAFMCSDDSTFMVGQTVILDGGTSALMSLISDFRNESANRFGRGYVPGA